MAFVVIWNWEFSCSCFVRALPQPAVKISFIEGRNLACSVPRLRR
jgi:hypothetical protein